MKILLIIPALNEAQTIANVIEKASAYGQVLVVDDGSSDATAEIAERSGAIVVSHAHNQGYDKALATGFRKATQDRYYAVITLDADGQHNPQILTEFIAALEAGADLALGVRAKAARVAEKIFRAYAYWRFGIKDILCGMKGYKVAFLETHIALADRRSIGTALAIQGAKEKLVMTQIAIPVYPRKDQSRLGSSLRANYLILRAMFS